jgi:membrane-associated phospholipid phosphatase
MLLCCCHNSIKVGVGQPRPNFMALSGYKNGEYTKTASEMREAFSAFPSGHSSMTAAGMTFLFLVLVATINRPGM